VSDDRLLGIYLNDHLGGANGGLALARRCAAENRGNPVGDVLAKLLPELEEDRAVLHQALVALGQQVDLLKAAGGWAVEKVSRLKLNGRLLGYSPLSRLVELEGLRVGTEGRMAMWQVLTRLQPAEPRLARFDFARLSERARRQQGQLEQLRLAAAELAFRGGHVLAEAEAAAS
jgi:hypothetical protein